MLKLTINITICDLLFFFQNNKVQVIAQNQLVWRKVDNITGCINRVSQCQTQLVGTNLIHDFMAVTFSVKLTSFREKC